MGNTVRIGTQVTGVKKASSDLDNLRDKFAKLQSQGAKGFAIGAGAAITAKAFDLVGDGAAKAVQFMGDAVNAASALAESTSKAGVVFGASVGLVQEFGEASAEAFGISKQAALEAAGTFGNLFLSTGLAKDAAAEMSVKAVQLAADLASFNNVPIEDALLAIRSGLVGEAEPMRKFGVLLNEATVKAKGMEMGLADAKGVMTDAAKVQARYAIILGQTGTAQGDFARTSDGMANTQRILAAQMEDVSAAIGEQLLPIMLDLAKGLKNDVIPAVEDSLKTWGHYNWAMAEQIRRTEELAFWQRGLLGLWTDSSQGVDAYAKSLADAAARSEAAARASATAAGNLQLVEDAVEGTLTPVRNLVSGMDRVGAAAKSSGKTVAKSLGEIADAFDATWSELSGAADQAAEDIFGPLERRAALAANKLAQGAAMGVIAAPKSSKSDIAGAKTDLLGLQKDYFTLTAEMAGRGELTAKELSKLTAALKTELKTASAEEAASINALIALLAKLKGAGANVWGAAAAAGARIPVGARAAGGPATGPTIVGDRGPELLNLPAGTMVNPSAAAGLAAMPARAVSGSDASARWLPIIAAQLSRLTAQEPYAARPMTARGDLARQASLMPGGRL